MTEAPRHLLRQLSLADFVTLSAVAFAISGLWLMAAGNLHFGISLTFFSMYLDYIDGAVARRRGGSPYGAVLDSLYDTIGWVIGPAFAVNIESHWNPFVTVATTIYCVAAVLRLSRFTVGGYVDTGFRNYVGLPVLVSQLPLVIVPLFSGRLSALLLILFVPFMISSRLIRKPPTVSALVPLGCAIAYGITAAVNAG